MMYQKHFQFVWIVIDSLFYGLFLTLYNLYQFTFCTYMIYQDILFATAITVHEF